MELERLVVEYGGSKVQNFMKGTNYVVAEDCESMKVQNLIERQQINIFKPLWVYDCIRFGYLVPLSPRYMAHANNELKNRFNKDMTKYGDSLDVMFKDPTEVLELAKQVTEDDAKILIKHLPSGQWWTNLPEYVQNGLREIKAYRMIGYTVFVNAEGAFKDLCETQVISMHGEISKKIDQSVTHIINALNPIKLQSTIDLTYNEFQEFFFS